MRLNMNCDDWRNDIIISNYNYNTTIKNLINE